MRIQDLIADMTIRAGEDVFRSASAVPNNKITWRPLGEGRSVLDLAGECAQMAEVLPTLLAPGGPDFSMFSDWKVERQGWKELAECRKAYDERLPKTLDAIRATTDEDLYREMANPFGAPGSTTKVVDILLHFYWQLTYHLGQINYVQTLYGDQEMH